jgi:hypothetical protein
VDETAVIGALNGTNDPGKIRSKTDFARLYGRNSYILLPLPLPPSEVEAVMSDDAMEEAAGDGGFRKA